MMSGERYIRIPGSKTHELPPLLVHAGEHAPSEDGADLDSVMVEAEEMLAETDVDSVQIEQRKFDLAVQLANQYKTLLSHWQWGDSVLDWIRQCETTFEYEETLRNLLHPDIWPHTNRSSFVTLLREKRVPTAGVALEKAVGLRLMFREPSPVRYFSNEFLFYLNSTAADAVYQSWAQSPDEASLLPPERFHFDVVTLDG